MTDADVANLERMYDQSCRELRYLYQEHQARFKDCLQMAAERDVLVLEVEKLKRHLQRFGMTEEQINDLDD